MAEESGQFTNVRITDADGIRATVRNLAANDALNVALVDSSGNQITSFGGVSMADDAAFTPGVSSVNVAGFVFDDTSPDSVDEGDAGAGRMSANRNQYVTIRDSAGNERGLAIDANGAIAVTGASGGTQYAVDAALGAAPTGTLAIAKRDDALSALTPIEGDAIELRVDANGALWTHDDALDAALAGSELQVDVVAALPTGANTIGAVTNTVLSVVGGGTEATAQRVTIASDSTGVLSVDDNGGSLTVDGAVAVTNAGTFAVQVDGAALTALQKIDNLAHAGSDVALVEHVPISGQFDDVATTAVTENQIAPVRISSRRALLVEGVASGTVIPVSDGGGALTVDWAGTAPPIGAGVEATALRVTVATDSTGVLSVDDNGGSLTIDNAQLSVVGGGTEAAAMRVTIASDSTGVLSIDDNGGSLTVDGTVAVTLAAGATAIAKAEDVASADADVGVPAMAVRKATPANVSGTDGDYEFLQISAGRLWASATIDAALPAGANAIGKLAANSGVDIGDVDVLTLPNVTLAAGTNTNEFVGDAAHDAAIAGNPVRIGGRALTADYTAVAAGDTADFITTLTGKQVVYPWANPNQNWSYAAPAGGLVTTTAVTVKAAAGAGIRNYITDIQVVNSHATTSTELTINDGAAGTVLWRGWLQAAGGGYSIHFNTPLRGTANTLLEIDEITATGTAGVLFDCQGFTAAE